MEPSLQRRHFLGLAAGAALVPPFVERGFYANGATNLERALARAKDRAKPLLVLVVPPEDTLARRERGAIWGEFLSRANDATLAVLALVEVTCATSQEIEKTGREKPSESTLAVLLETGADRSMKSVSSEGISMRTLYSQGSGPWDYEEGGKKRVEQLSSRIRETILRGDDRLDGLFEQWNARYGSDHEHWHLHDVLLHGESARPRLRDVDLAAVVVYRYARSSTEAMKAWREHLANAASMRLFESDLDGARWRTNSSYCPPCGMGRTPEIARHFLEFYTDDGPK